MRSLKWLPILILMLVGVASSGCSFLPEKEVYLAPGQAVEVAEKTRVSVYVTNKATGKREKRSVVVRPDGIWHVGKLPPEGYEEVTPPPKKSPGWWTRFKSFFSKG